MAKFDETLKLVKQSIATLMTKEGVSDKDLELFTSLTKQVDELGTQHQELVDSHAKMKDKYIEAVVGCGTKTPPKDDVDSGKEKTFEEIAQEHLSKAN